MMDKLKESVKSFVIKLIEDWEGKRRVGSPSPPFSKGKNVGKHYRVNKLGMKVKLVKYRAGQMTPIVSINQKRIASKYEYYVASLIGSHVKVQGDNKPNDLEGRKYLWEVKCIFPTNKNYKPTLSKKKVKRKLREAKAKGKKVGAIFVDFKAKGMKNPVYWYSDKLKSPRLGAKKHKSYLTKVGDEREFKKFMKKRGLV